MRELLFRPDALKAIATVLILLAAVYGFVSERVPPDLVSLLALLALLVLGILSPGEAFSGFSHPATISVAAVLVLSAGIERTGLLSFVARRVLGPLGKSEVVLTLLIMLVIGFLSAFINNTAAVAVFIPVVIEVCRRTGASPGRILMPMSHAATFGGMCTLIGTSTNLVAHEYALSKGLPGFSMFEFGKVGLPMLIAGTAYILIVGRRFLPKQPVKDAKGPGQSDRYLGEVLVQAEAPWIGREIDREILDRDFELELLGVVRDGQVMSLDYPKPRYASGDSLWVRGQLEQLLLLVAQDGLELDRPTRKEREQMSTLPSDETKSRKEPKETEETQLSLAEVVVLTTSGLIGQTLREARFAERFDAVVLALKRRDKVSGGISTTRLHAGDVLVVEGKEDALRTLAETRGFLVIGAPAYPERPSGKTAIALITLLAVILTVSFGLLPIVTAATGGCAVLMLTRCLRPRDAYRAIDLSIIFVLAGSLALGFALDKTGVTTLLASALAGLSGLTGPYVVLIVFFLAAVLISELMSNGGTVVILAPIALSTAVAMNINPMTVLVAITFGASAAFAMPIGYQTSLMVYGPGGYRARDFIRMGLVLDLLLAIIALVLIPYYWPLR
ncbi:MAG: SLC13 family permease [Pyrinomonadaceae bacterium]